MGRYMGGLAYRYICLYLYIYGGPGLKTASSMRWLTLIESGPASSKGSRSIGGPFGSLLEAFWGLVGAVPWVWGLLLESPVRDIGSLRALYWGTFLRGYGLL